MTNLTNPIFHDENKARQHLERVRWPNGPFCPHCGDVENSKPLAGKSHRAGLHKCYSCNGHFTVTVGTVFERSKIPLHKWILAAHLMASSKKGISAHQIHRTLGVTYKTAWFMEHRLREAMKGAASGLLGGGGGIVEGDETFVGRKPGKKRNRGFAHKNAVFSLVERDGGVRSFHVPNVTANTLKPIIQAHMAREANFMTDDAGQYRILGPIYASHQTVAHSQGEYVRGNIHTNTAEGFFSIFKRGVMGTFHHLSEQHLQRYMHEFDFRYTHRERRVKIAGKWQKVGPNDSQRAELLLKGIGGRRLTYY